MHIKPAKRTSLVQEYYFATKLREIAQMQASGIPVRNLGIGSPDLSPAPEVITAMQTALAFPHVHGYQSYIGLPELRKAMTDWYAEHYQVYLNPDDEVLPLMGSKEGIMHIAMAFLEPGDVALVPNPGYPSYRAASLLAGAEVWEYDLREDGHWLPDFDALERLDLSRVKILWANYPHMPTGTPASATVFERLVQLGLRYNILIVNDNPYSFILNDTPESILKTAGAKAVALELNSLSKSHNMAGWRMGMLMGHADLIRAVLRFKSNMDSGQHRPLQMAAAAALRLPKSWYRDQNNTYVQRQKSATALLESLGCSVAPGQQGLFLWGKVPADYPDGFAMSDALLYEKHMFITPGGIFGSNGQHYVRISLCHPY
jgi:LL-diaminopimelate aminotransferase